VIEAPQPLPAKGSTTREQTAKGGHGMVSTEIAPASGRTQNQADGHGWWPGCQLAPSSRKGFSPTGQRRSQARLFPCPATENSLAPGASGDPADGSSRQGPKGLPSHKPTSTNQTRGGPW
jgi:hypothetical protein